MGKVKCNLCGKTFEHGVALVTHAVFYHNWNINYSKIKKKKERRVMGKTKVMISDYAHNYQKGLIKGANQERIKIKKELKKKFANGKYWKGKTIMNFIDNYLKQKEE